MCMYWASRGDRQFIYLTPTTGDKFWAIKRVAAALWPGWPDACMGEYTALWRIFEWSS
jgi:hypothetical protein